MPLDHGSSAGEQYLRRVRIMVDPEERDFDRSEDQFDFVFPLNNTYEHVASIELVDYNVRQTLQTWFTDVVPANNWVDIYVEDVATGLETLNFSVEFTPSVRDGVRTLVDLALQIQTELNQQMDAQGHAYFNTANAVIWRVDASELGNVNGVAGALIYSIRIGPVPDTIIANFLFGTGANRHRSAARIMGFTDEDTAVFTVGVTTYYNPVPNFIPVMVDDRYLDVIVHQAEEYKPLARIYLTDDTNFERQKLAVKRTRFLTNSIKRLQELSISLRLPGGRKPIYTVGKGVDLIFELLLVASENHVPEWLNQNISL